MMYINIGAGKFLADGWINLEKDSKFFKSIMQDNTIYHDLLALSELPFDDNSIDLAYTSHVIEHVTDAAAFNLFSQVFKKLKSGAGFRIVCPDMNFFLGLYLGNVGNGLFYSVREYPIDREIIYDEYKKLPLIDASIQQRFLWAFARQASIHHNKASLPLVDDEVDKLFSLLPNTIAFDECTSRCNLSIQYERPEDHINWWIKEKLISFLEYVGFSNIRVSKPGDSVFKEMTDNVYFDKPLESNIHIEAIK